MQRSQCHLLCDFSCSPSFPFSSTLAQFAPDFILISLQREFRNARACVTCSYEIPNGCGRNSQGRNKESDHFHHISFPCFRERTRKTRSPKWWFGSRKVAWKAHTMYFGIIEWNGRKGEKGEGYLRYILSCNP